MRAGIFYSLQHSPIRGAAPMRVVPRRRFLEESLLAAGLAATASSAHAAARTTVIPTHRAGPNEAVRVAVVGVRGRGMEHIEGFSKVSDARIVAICDCDQNVIG